MMFCYYLGHLFGTFRVRLASTYVFLVPCFPSLGTSKLLVVMVLFFFCDGRCGGGRNAGGGGGGSGLVVFPVVAASIMAGLW